MLKNPANTLNSPDMLFNSSDIDLNQREYSSMYVDIYTTRFGWKSRTVLLWKQSLKEQLGSVMTEK